MRSEGQPTDGLLLKALIAAAFIIVALALLWGHLILWPQEFREGQVVPHTIFAPVAFEYEDSQKLAELTGQAGDNQQFNYVDPVKADVAAGRFTQFKRDFNDLRQQLRRGNISEDEEAAQIEVLARQYGLPVAAVSNFVVYEDDRLGQVFADAGEKLAQEMSRPVTEAYLRALQHGGASDLLPHPENIYMYFMQVNVIVYRPPDLKGQRQDLARIAIEKGSVLVVEGSRVDRRVYEQLTGLKGLAFRQSLYRFLGLAVILIVLTAWLWLYMARFKPTLTAPSSISQLAGLFLLFMFVGLVIGRLPFNYFYYAVIFAIAALATLVVMVYDAMFALYLALGVGLLLSVALSFGANLMLYTVAGALLPTVYLTPGAARRQQVLFAFAFGLVSLALAMTVVLISVQTLHWEVLLISFMAGFTAVVLALGLLPVVETLTAQLTPGKLTELANPENTLLRRLKREAHGTYVHSEMVADLTEEACKDISADWQLAKVGALYHDIGKLKRPGFFAENIYDLDKNPHDGLPPETSVKILRDHVADGLHMAREARLPAKLHQFISEHHGNYRIRFFYHKAQKLHKADPEEHPEPDPANYSYSGPIPRSRESGVVMLADVTEAVTRAQGVTDTEDIRCITEKIITDKLEENQLVDSSLSVGDLARIKDAFCRILVAQRHTRVRYPDEKAPPMQFHYGDQNGGLGNASK